MKRGTCAARNTAGRQRRDPGLRHYTIGACVWSDCARLNWWRGRGLRC